ncbi:DUF421 domain-containing protein [Pseudomonas sp. CDFA 602]|uniref:DUF421 domain-containing protein n=1 Tax=Pseudomonas californiensis TaxID=2829823 RepID=UPI001E4C020A|nr:YetF domain-containing protein [Pseudomonas californiensis]MCD5996204.1 DUF421 domain-containing protein [Pseudomonas californiensis]MCD6001748.1 DUF421 domain-containing protein [Pseudomonas californiensis]
MSPFDLQRMLIDEFPLSFLLEVAFRTTFAFLAVFLFLKSSGRRGIRQLSLFELVVILTLGSAAGDVSFYHDVPLLPVTVVFLSLLLLYRLTVWVMTKSKKFEAIIDGLPVTVINDGLYELKSLGKLNISSSELLMELRQQGVEHLGQVRLGLIETDGDISLYFYDPQDVRPGMSVLPLEHRAEFQIAPESASYCCVNCGFSQHILEQQTADCARCHEDIWSRALSTRRSR